MAELGPSSSILVLHDHSLDPVPFLQREAAARTLEYPPLTKLAGLTANPGFRLDEPIWPIDNKYYTASVRLDVESLPAQGAVSSPGGTSRSGDGIPVVLYLFDRVSP
jgi:hypothetical protein